MNPGVLAAPGPAATSFSIFSQLARAANVREVSQGSWKGELWQLIDGRTVTIIFGTSDDDICLYYYLTNRRLINVPFRPRLLTNVHVM